MPENLAALRAGTVDVIQIFEPWVEQALLAGDASICHVAADRGLTSYTTLYTRRPFLQQHPDVAEQFVRGIYDAQRWIAAHDAGALADLVRDFFPDLERPVLTGGIRRYLDNSVWGRTPWLEREGFERQAAGLSSGGLIGPPPAYEDCIDMQFVERVLASTEES